MGLDDPRGRLVLEFIRVVRESLPVAFVMENVKGMVNWQNGEAIDAIVNEISSPILYENKTYKYEVKMSVMNAAEYGAPQLRERIFIVGNRINKKFVFPKKTHSDKSNREIDIFNQDKEKYKTVWDNWDIGQRTFKNSIKSLRNH